MNIKKMKQPAHGKKTTVINLKQLTATTILLLGSSLVTTAHSQIIEQKSNSSPIDNQPNSTKTGFENIVFTDATNINPTHSEPATPSITDDQSQSGEYQQSIHNEIKNHEDNLTSVPLPATTWLFITGLMGFFYKNKKRTITVS